MVPESKFAENVVQVGKWHFWRQELDDDRISMTRNTKFTSDTALAFMSLARKNQLDWMHGSGVRSAGTCPVWIAFFGPKESWNCMFQSDVGMHETRKIKASENKAKWIFSPFRSFVPKMSCIGHFAVTLYTIKVSGFQKCHLPTWTTFSANLLSGTIIQTCLASRWFCQSAWNFQGRLTNAFAAFTPKIGSIALIYGALHHFKDFGYFFYAAEEVYFKQIRTYPNFPNLHSSSQFLKCQGREGTCLRERKWKGHVTKVERKICEILMHLKMQRRNKNNGNILIKWKHTS